ELAELEVGPGLPHVTLLVSHRYPRLLANAGHVFEGECLARSGGFRHQGLADAVVGGTLKTSLPARVPLQATLGVLGPHLLRALAAQVVATAHAMRLGAGEALSVAIGSEVDDAQVHAEHICGPVLGGRVAALRHMQVVHAPPPEEGRAAHLPGRVY